MERTLSDEARRAVAGATGAGACSVLLRVDGDSCSLVDVRPGLGGGCAVTEMTTGVDLVKLQLKIADGGSLDNEPPTDRAGHAITAHVRAEDAEQHLQLESGKVAVLRLPGGPGVRIDRTVAEGDNLTRQTHGAIITLTAWGRDRDEAVVRLRRALDETVVVVEGGTTNRRFLLGQLSATSGDPARASSAAPDAVPGLLMAAIDRYDTELMSAHASFFASSRRGRPQAAGDLSRRVELRHHGCRYVLDVSRTGPIRYRVRLGGTHTDVDLRRVGRFESRMVVAGREHRVVSTTTGTHHDIEVDGAAHLYVADDGSVVRSPMPGVVVSVCVAPGDVLEAGDTVAVVESMKLETVVRVPTAGRVNQVPVSANVHVPAGAILVRLEADADSPIAATTALQLPAPVHSPPGGPSARCEVNLFTLSNLILGYDVEPADARAAVDDWSDVCFSLGADSDVVRREILLVTLFADLRMLFRSQHDEGDHEVRVRSPQEHFFAYLRSLDASREGLPRQFVTDLRRALAHYGVRSLERRPALQDALYWIFQSQQRVATQLPAIVAVLERWLHAVEPVAGTTGDALRECLDHLIAATMHRYPVIADLARDVQFHQFDEPVLARARLVELAAMEQHLTALGDDPGGAARAEHIRALVDCPLPLAPLLLGRISGVSEAERWVALEVMTRRYYRMRALGELAAVSGRRHAMLRGSYNDEHGARVQVLTVTGPIEELSHMVAAAASSAEAMAATETIVLDVYAWSAGPLGGSDELAEEFRSVLDASSLPTTVRRVVVVLAGAGSGSGRMSSLRHHTFRWSPEGFLEDEFLRGLHPLMATRLRLSRLRNFSIERLPAGDDVYLFRASARANPDDERLFALAEVRDLTTLRDSENRVLALPQLERVLLEAIAGIRQFQAPRPPEQRLYWNRILLHVWPPVLLSLAEIKTVARRLAPTIDGLGLERIDVQCRRPDPVTGELRDRVLRISNPAGKGFVLTETDPQDEPLQPLDEYTRKLVQARRRGTAYPYEIVEMVTAPQAGAQAEIAGGSFTEYDLDGDRLLPVARPYGNNTAGMVVGVISNVSERYPEGMLRVTLLGDPTRALGSLAEPECRRIIAALDLADSLGVPVDWFALSAGAKIAMDSGTESMDWIAAVLRRIIEFTQRGGAINVIVTGINVGGQPYWNAEATMLMHTKGILVMTPDSAMVLTGKQALDYSGGVSADDNFGIGGYERVMGPNGQAQYWAPDLDGAIGILLAHHTHTYVAPGER
ncbi:MAG TPA: biotin/lipoyl-containing protein, partial [Ilumatobacteraceae bacterium]|nr:biotin/lipoyl-containing protein [Ilumatobacteraceae bacterium]